MKEHLSQSGFPMLMGLPVDICIFTVSSVPRSELDYRDRRSLHALPDYYLEILLIKRAEEPFRNTWSLPGGFTDIRRETLEDAALRELLEETHISTGLVGPTALRQLKAYYSPTRDPRGYTPTVAFVALLNESVLASAQAGGDAKELKRFRVQLENTPESPWLLIHPDGEKLLREHLAFDHGNILSDALDQVRSDILHTPMAKTLLPEAFTLAQLQQIISAIVPDFKMSSPNFSRDLLKSKTRTHLLEPVLDGDGEPVKSTQYSARPAQLYRFSDDYQPRLSIYPGY